VQKPKDVEVWESWTWRGLVELYASAGYGFNGLTVIVLGCALRYRAMSWTGNYFA
jgi:hypothetical protein